jgi:hypothetical protein
MKEDAANKNNLYSSSSLAAKLTLGSALESALFNGDCVKDMPINNPKAQIQFCIDHSLN